MFIDPELQGRKSAASPDRPSVKYIDAIINAAKESLKTKNGFPATFFAETKSGQIHPMIVPSSMLDNKDELASALKAVVGSLELKSHCLLSESWIHKIEAKSEKEAHEIFQSVQENGTASNTVKGEAIVVALAEINADEITRWNGVIEFHRDADNNVVSFDEEQWLCTARGGKVTGRFVI